MNRRDEIPTDAWDILTDRPTGYVATLRPDGHISVNPVGLIYDGEHVRFSTTKARKKYRNMVADDRVSMVVPYRNDSSRYIEIRGHAQMEDDNDRSFINQLAALYLGIDRYPLDVPSAERVTVTINVEQVSFPTLPRRRDEALEMLTSALKDGVVGHEDVQAFMTDYDMDSDAGVESMIGWLSQVHPNHN
jgi:PPOX class probable F420-dependent enzyme